MAYFLTLLITLCCIFGGCDSLQKKENQFVQNEKIQLEDESQDEIEEFNFGPNPGD